MKLLNKIFGVKFRELLILIFILSAANLLIVINTGDCGECDDKIIPPGDLEDKIDDAKNIKSLKFLFMYKYHGVENEPHHKLNLFTYKNILLSLDQIVFFESPNENDPVKLNFLIF
jgi:hypothetical protein